MGIEPLAPAKAAGRRRIDQAARLKEQPRRKGPIGSDGRTARAGPTGALLAPRAFRVPAPGLAPRTAAAGRRNHARARLLARNMLPTALRVCRINLPMRADEPDNPGCRRDAAGF